VVVGVLKDYHQQSLKQAFEPHIFRFLPEGRDVRGLFALNVGTPDMKSMIQKIKTRFDEFFPGNPFEYYFLDEYYDRQYQADERFGTVVGIFSLLAMIVTGLGILGLTSFMVVQRTKEIGLRKILGAGVSRILLLFTMDLLRLILLSFFLVLPLSYLGIRSWLESFAVRMIPSLGLFLIPLVLVTVITGLTICSHLLKAARADPIVSLRYE